MSRVVVLGAGRVGALIARELAREPEFDVLAVDSRAEPVEALEEIGVEGRVSDVADPRALRALAGDADVAVSAVPGVLGFGVLRSLIEAGVSTVDISFSPEDPLSLDGAAREREVAAVVDCGVAPGLSNLMAGRSAAGMDEVDSLRILVGGLPAERDGVWDYRAVFSPADVIEEYVRPCRMRVDGEDVVIPALTGLERVEFDGVGTLEAFHTDGLRTLLSTIPARTMIEKTLRWPGHAEKVRALRDSGFFDRSTVRAGHAEVAPRDIAVRLLTRAWALRNGEEELTVLRVEVEGKRDGTPTREVWELFDRTDRASGDTSMARTTGFPAVAVAKIVAEGRIPPGVWPPERLDAEVADRVLEEVRARGVTIHRSREVVGRA